MTRPFLIASLVFLTNIFFGQKTNVDKITTDDYWPVYLNWDKQETIDEVKNIKWDDYNMSMDQKGDTTTFFYSGKRSWALTFAFTNNQCRHQAITFKCDSCTIYYVDKILADKSFDWVKIKDNYYASSKIGFGLTLKYDSKNICNSVVYSYSTVNRKTIKKLKNAK